MDPNNPSTEQWQQIVNAVNGLWLFVLLIVIGALSFLLAQGYIPSLLATRQLPAGAGGARPVLYVVSGLAIIAGIFAALGALNLTYSVLSGIYPRWWI